MAASGGDCITKGATHSDASYVPLSAGIQADYDLREVGLARRSVLYMGPRSTNLREDQRETISTHEGGILYDLGAHRLDQVIWLLGRPAKVTTLLRNDGGVVPKFKDNTLGVFEFENALALIDIAAIELAPMARRFEVYGNEGSAIITEPFQPGKQIRLCLKDAKAGYQRGEQPVMTKAESRHRLSELELEAFVATLAGTQPPDRPLSHELLVQETLLRGTGAIPILTTLS